MGRRALRAVREEFWARQTQNTSRRKDYEVESFMRHDRFGQRESGTAPLQQQTRKKPLHQKVRTHCKSYTKSSCDDKRSKTDHVILKGEREKENQIRRVSKNVQ